MRIFFVKIYKIALLNFFILSYNFYDKYLFFFCLLLNQYQYSKKIN